ncbi:MAG: hypothetical protein M3Z24_01305 [Chloroflexota bacterium]|nr:hypothetical protein [Chloroflexota bacterium]
MKKLMIICILFGLITVMLVACGGSSGDSSNNINTHTNNTVSVHMNASDFVQNTVTLKKGDSINLLDDVAGVHVVENGTYEGATIKHVAENGAPSVDVQFNGNDSHVIGPFPTAGNFHYYCTVHLDMNLTVTVQ